MLTAILKSNGAVRLLNIGLRGMTLVSKFLLIFFLARFLEPSDVGLYGLFAVTVTYTLYFLGLDFYVFTTREILKSKQTNRGRLIKSQIGLVLLLYVVFLPLSLSLFYYGLLPWRLAPWFIALLVLEHINQELNRLLVALNRQIIASWILFFRSGVWALALVALMAIDSNQRNLESVMLSWSIGGIIAFVIGSISIGRSGLGGWSQSIDWNWVNKGLKVAIPMLVSSVALRGIFTLDRYWFEEWVGIEVLGAYVLFIGVATALQSFMDAAVFTFLYPSMISSYANGQSEIYRKKYRQMIYQSISLIVFLCIVMLLLIEPVVNWLNRPVYTDNIEIFYWVLLANVFFILGLLPQYGLYSQGVDKPIIISNLLGFFVFVFSTYTIGLIDKEIAVPAGLLVACLFVFLFKMYAFNKLTPDDWKPRIILR